MINLQSGAAWDNKKLAVCSELSVTASHVDSVSSRAVNETLRNVYNVLRFLFSFFKVDTSALIPIRHYVEQLF